MRGFAVGVGAAAVAAAVALVSGCAPRPLALPRSAKAPMLYVALGDSTVEGIGASSPAATTSRGSTPGYATSIRAPP